jgi:hypothetical protein
VNREFAKVQLLLALIVTVTPPAASAETIAQDKEAIRHLAWKMWDQPGAPLSVDPVVVVMDCAISGWTQGDQGGRALLRQQSHAWEVILCSGDQLKTADTARAAGVPADIAERLKAGLVVAKKRVNGDRLGKFSLFDGNLRTDGRTAHKRAGTEGRDHALCGSWASEIFSLASALFVVAELYDLVDDVLRQGA